MADYPPSPWNDEAVAAVALPAHEKVLGMDHPHTLSLKKAFGEELALLAQRSSLSHETSYTFTACSFSPSFHC
jgi:hypothetical protein